MSDTSDHRPPRFILHVGMGKTGTSAIQKALGAGTAELAAQGALFLGAELAIPGRPLRGWDALSAFFASPPEELHRLGQDYADSVDDLADAQGADCLILSNEAFHDRARPLTAFLAPLRRIMEVRVLIWARNPVTWLPSAHAQWSVRHKTMPGRVEPFGIGARRHVNQYRGIVEWFEVAPELVELHPYREDSDMVAEFAAAAGISLPPAPERVYERPEPAELVLRALYNSRFDGPVMPDRYERAVGRGAKPTPRIERAINGVLDYGEAAEIVAENAAIFDAIAAATGIDLRALGGSAPEMPPSQQTRRRLLDELTAITLDQAARILTLEERLARLEARLADPGA